MQGGSWGVRRGLVARVGVAEGILLVAEEDSVAVVVNDEKTGTGCYLDQAHTGLEVDIQYNILGPLEGDIHRSLAVAVVAVGLGGTFVGGTSEGARHSNHSQPYCFC